ncbi:hypothetical protein E4T38_08554 [Aureobasidium subglaciale]|nr:hypothetical protein E4T38_08554 [Aureobasidium subglaciale]KAI5215232.1 hypothetical protein E4T40_08512 [Aureobasidium subglaciale]KAI5218455.1 hypothetical protein E4T41_08365 [Aureobasidium subglaciale]KAI5256076.1 hypothetical protein E4T46_08400 [Aureobasidium subglaciale]
MSTPRLLLLPNTLVQLFDESLLFAQPRSQKTYPGRSQTRSVPQPLLDLCDSAIVSPRLGQLSTVDHSRSNLTTSAHTFCPAIFSCETCYPLRNGYAGTDLASVIMSKTSLQTLPW